MRILNSDKKDYHIHSSNFSDWTSSIEVIVRFSWDIWLKEIAITDHSDIYINNRWDDLWKQWFSCRRAIKRWKNVFNNVKVIFWVEWDLLNEKWDISSTIQWIEQDFVILSVHKIYKSEPDTITTWYINAIKRYHGIIKAIGHPCDNW